MSTCTISDFQFLVTKLNNEWDSFWSIAAIQGPKQAGISFGSCYTNCGSLGITNVGGLDAVNLDTANATATFTTCNVEDYIVVVVPIEQTTILVDVQVRASGPNGLYPSVLGDEFVNDAPCAFSGFVLISIPVRSRKVILSELTVDFTCFATWATPFVWPDTSNILYNGVPFQEILYEWSESFIEYLRSNLVKPLRNALRDENEYLTCVFPTAYEQTCTASTEMPIGPCHPCDTCCKCLIQQRCDGGCSDCECVNCETYNLWTVSYAVVIFLIVLFVIFWYADGYAQYNQLNLYADPGQIDPFGPS